MISLRPYQVEGNTAFKREVSAGRTRTIVSLPTGCGKTIAGLSLAKDLGVRTLWIAHREELLTQPARALRTVWPGAESGIVKAERNECTARDVVFASIQTIANTSRLFQLGRFGLVVVDEAHHAAAASYRKVLEYLGCMRQGGTPLLGLTATVERSDQAALEQVFDGIAYQMPLLKAMQQGYLAAIRPVRRKLNIDLDAISYRQGDWATSELNAALLEADIVKEVANAIDEHARERKTIVFTVSVQQAHAVADELRARGYPAEAIDGTMPPSIRQAKLARLASGETRIVVNCAVLTEGFDEPSVDCVVMARPTASKTLYLQCLGRGLRLYPGKSDCLVIDLVGVSQKHTLMQAPVLLGAELADQEKREAKPQEVSTYDYAEVLKKQVEGLGGACRSRMVWVRQSDSMFALPVGEHGTIVLERAADGWISHVLGRRTGESREALCSDPVSQELALGIAEDYVRRVGAARLVDREASWRTREPSERQMQTLAKAKIKATPATAGEASDLLAAHFAAVEVEPATSRQLWALRRAGLIGENDTPTKREASRMIAKMHRGAA